MDCPFVPPARAVCPFSFLVMRCLCQSSAQIAWVSKLGPRADREGSLMCELHRRDPGFGCLFKNGCGVLPAVVS